METFGTIMTLLGAAVGILGGLCAIVVPLGIAAGLGVFLYRRSKQRGAAMQAAQSWPHTSGTVLQSSVQSRSTDNGTSIFPLVVYSYTVNGKSYQSQIIKAGDQVMSVRIMGDAQKTVNRYPAGAKVTVYYNPDDPKQAALER